MIKDIKDIRAKQFENLQETFSLYDLGWRDASVIKPDFFKDRPKKSNSQRGQIRFVEDNVINAMPQGSLVLVFASAKNPGGGVQSGARAQEEDISLHTSWFYHVRKLKGVKGFYLEKNASALNTDDMLYVKNAHVLTDIYHNELGVPVPVSFLGAAAPNLNGLKNQGRSVKEVYDVMEKRVERVLRLAERYGHTHLVLGAWGCGVFGLESERVAQIFKEKIREDWFSGDITFSMMDKKTLDVFKSIITEPPHSPPLCVSTHKFISNFTFSPVRLKT